MPFINDSVPLVGSARFRRGFTLIELAVTLTVVGILAAITVPAFQTFLRSNRLSTSSNDLLADLNFARASAIKRQAGIVIGQVGQVVVCVSSNGTDCTGGTDTWSDGWIIFWDQDKSGTFSAAAKDVMLKSHGSIPSTVTVSTSPAGVQLISYNALGMSQVGQVSVLLSDASLGKNRKVTINSSGQGSVLCPTPTDPNNRCT